MRLLITGALACFLISTSLSTAFGQSIGANTLTGTSGFTVFVENLGTQASTLGLSSRAIEQDIESILANSGVPVVDEDRIRESMNGSEDILGILYVEITVFESSNVQGLLVFSVISEVRQLGMFGTRGQAWATTYKAGAQVGNVGVGGVMSIREIALSHARTFASDWHRYN
jgi:hypothetical protein